MNCELYNAATGNCPADSKPCETAGHCRLLNQPLPTGTPLIGSLIRKLKPSDSNRLSDLVRNMLPVPSKG